MKIFKNNMYHNKRVEEVSYKLNIPEHQIEEALDIMYSYIKLKIESTEVDEDVLMDEEEFDNTFPTIHIPSLGYFRPSFRKYEHQMKNKAKKNGKDES